MRRVAKLSYCDVCRRTRDEGHEHDPVWDCFDEYDDEEYEGRTVRAPDAATAAKRYAEEECFSDSDLYAAYEDGQWVFVRDRNGEVRVFTVAGETTVVFRAKELRGSR